MSKKNAPQQLQTDITNDEDLEKFMLKDGLLLLEVYTGWCGPCISMLSALKKIKLEKGGEDLVLATVRSDDVQTFARLQNKSEPTWLLAVRGKLVTGMFGSNVPRLMQMIGDEIDAYRRLKEGGDPADEGRRTYELGEMVPCEQERYDARKAIEDRNAQMAIDTAASNRIAYIRQVLGNIADRLPDFGVTVMLPHCLNKDIIKQVPIIGEKFGLTVKDKKLVQMVAADLELLHFECVNRLPQFALNALFAREAFMVAWKKADAELQPVETVLRQLVDLLQLPQPIKGDVSEDPVRVAPVLRAMQLLVTQAEWDEYREGEVTEDQWTRERLRSFESHRRAGEEAAPAAAEEAPAGDAAAEVTPEVAAEDADGAEDGAEEKVDVEVEVTETEDAGEGESTAIVGDDSVAADTTETLVEEPAAEEPGELLPVEMLPIWTPANKTTQAALIYLYFRNLTDHFLPPDPQPDPPHVAIVFDAFKRHELMSQIEAAPDDILAYGFFTTEQPEAASLLATSTFKYERLKKKSIADRMVLKVSKQTSHTLLALTSQVPCYVSMNTVEGELDCRKFFPDGYKMSSETGEDEEDEVEEEEEPPTEAVADDDTADNPTEQREDGDGEGPADGEAAVVDGNAADVVAGEEIAVPEGNVDTATE